VLVTLAKLLAPVMPFLTEAMYQNLVRTVASDAPVSVHHCLWPVTQPLAEAEGVLVDSMTAVRQAATLGHSVRAAGNLKVRQPLSRALIAADPRSREALSKLLDLLADELNVKEVTFVEEEGELVTYTLLPLNKVLGPKFGNRFPLVRKALSALPSAETVRKLKAGEAVALTLEDGSQAELTSDEILVQTQAREGYGVAGEGGLVVALDTKLTPELEQEGLAREIVRRVQDLRKQADYQLTDRIVVQYKADGPLAEAITAFKEAIAAEVLANTLEASSAPEGDKVLEDTIDAYAVVLGVRRA
ncbi:MAG: DUF5915 domain-containing protein, partial [Anaerolineae bacterium]|jgi:isoleucyl-tRNA synthetase|nr:DUF5915 domain-containing protein [Anaerolineae bacterium]